MVKTERLDTETDRRKGQRMGKGKWLLIILTQMSRETVSLKRQLECLFHFFFFFADDKHTFIRIIQDGVLMYIYYSRLVN